MKPPRWLTLQGMLALHDKTIADHGGSPGLRDLALLESALARPQNHFDYEGQADLVMLAAIYASGIAANHPFVDGNKRAAFLAAGLFLDKNDVVLTAKQADAALTFLKIAAGEMSVSEVAAWLTTNCQPIPPAPSAA